MKFYPILLQFLAMSQVNTHVHSNKCAQQSVPHEHRGNPGTARQGRCNALDAGDRRPYPDQGASQGTACGIYGKHFALRGFGFFLLPNGIHARPSATMPGGQVRDPQGADANSCAAEKVGLCEDD